jgi:hypothetical protein
VLTSVHLAVARGFAHSQRDEYVEALFAHVPVLPHEHGPYATLPGIFHGAVLGHSDALRVALQDLKSAASFPDANVQALEELATWFLDYEYFRAAFTRVNVSMIMGDSPVRLSDQVAGSSAVAAVGYLRAVEDRDDFPQLAALAPLAIHDFWWDGSSPETWGSL